MKASPKPIVHVEAGGQSRPVRFGFNALADFCEAAGLSLADLQGLDLSSLGLKSLRALYWAGFKDGARKEGEPFAASMEDVGDWMDDLSPEAQATILQAFAGAQGASEEAASGPAGKGKKPTRKAA